MADTTNTTFDAQAVARDLRSHLETACGEIAHDMTSDASGFLDEKWDKKIKNAKKRGVRDVQGWLADELYNDPDTIQDMIGDKLHEACNGDKAKQNLVLDILGHKTHAGMRKAVAALRKLVNS